MFYLTNLISLYININIMQTCQLSLEYSDSTLYRRIKQAPQLPLQNWCFHYEAWLYPVKRCSPEWKLTTTWPLFPGIIIIIIMMSCCKHGYPWPSLPTSPYRSSPQAGLQGYIPYVHIAAECIFQLVVLLLLGHMWESIGVHHLWASPCFSSNVLNVWFV